jgi:hypothetical protein
MKSANAAGAQLLVITAHGLPSTLEIPQGFINEGRIELQPHAEVARPLPAAALSVSLGTLVNATGGVIVSAPFDDTNGILAGTIDNRGRIEIQGGTLLLNVGSTLDTQSGTLEFDDDDARLELSGSLLKLKSTSLSGPAAKLTVSYQKCRLRYDVGGSSMWVRHSLNARNPRSSRSAR